MPDRPRQFRLNTGWRFHLGDIPAPLANTHIAAYMNNKAGYARGAAKTNFDDSDWREVQLPHDWSVEGEFNPENHMDAGYLPRGIGWYRRYVRLEESDRGKHIELNFDGVATHCTVYVNGHLLHRNFCGYTPFTIDISDVATFGDALNTIAVKVDANWMEGWWYEGAGIYRDVELTIRQRGSFIKHDEVSVSADTAGTIKIVTPVRLSGPPNAEGATLPAVFHTVLNAEGSVVAQSDPGANIEGFVGHLWDRQFLFVTAPNLWSSESPCLYTLRTELRVGGFVVDEVQTHFGFRTIRFDPDKGFFLNGQRTFLKGVCLHQDHAGVGVAVPESIERFRLLQFKSIGVNAIRCAHNPPSKVFLDLCDELGFLVMNEIRNFGSSPEHLRQLEAVVKRDRHHPSIILWSICNEEAIQGSPVAANIAKSMVDRVRALDSTRPITGAISGGLLDETGLAAHVRGKAAETVSGCPGAGTPDPRSPSAGQGVPCPGAPGYDHGAFDVVSINYNLPLHDAYHQKHPHVPIVISETGCTYATRGIKTTDTEKHHFAEDDSAYAPWGMSAQATWDHIQARPYIAGMFVWTGIDYRGEPTPHAWPSVQSHWGLFDLCCFPKRAARLHESFFKGQPEQTAPPRPDELTIELPSVIEDLPILADGRFTLPITIASPTDEILEIDVAGPGKLIGVGNGDPTSHLNKGSRIAPFNGLAQALVQTTNEPGRIIVRVTNADGDTVAKSFVSVPSTDERSDAAVVFPRHFVSGWRMSALSTSPIDPHLVVSDQDMNSWERIDPARGPQTAWARADAATPSFALYRAMFTLPKSMQSAGAILRFHRVVGEPEFFVNGSQVSARRDGEVFEIRCDGSVLAQAVTVRLRSLAGPAGIADRVELVPLPREA